MLILISILFVSIFIGLFHNQIKKHSNIFYIIAIIISIGFILYFQLNLNDQVPKNINKYFITIFSKSIVSTAIFTVVMYTGVLNKKMYITKKLLSIRGELSVIACILTLGHNILYGMTNFVKLFTNPTSMKLPKLMAAIVSVLLITIMIPLMVTSFNSVKRRIQFKKWKSIQRLSYVFYGLIYVHIMCLIMPKMQKGKFYDVLIYTFIFALYYIARIYRLKKDKDNKIKNRLSISQNI